MVKRELFVMKTKLHVLNDLISQSIAMKAVKLVVGRAADKDEKKFVHHPRGILYLDCFIWEIKFFLCSKAKFGNHR